MARPTINFTSGSQISGDGEYYFEVPLDTPCSFVGKGIIGGGTLTLKAFNPNANSGEGALVSVTGGSWTAEFEDGFTSPFNVMLLEMTGSTSPSLYIFWSPIKQHTHDT
jgi:hypothetical protein